MPVPERYQEIIRPIVDIWEPAGYFRAQGQIWLARAEARSELKGAPSTDQLAKLEGALILTDDELRYLITAGGHETNNYLTLVQNKLDPENDPETGNYLHEGLTSSDVLDTSAALQHLWSLDILLENQYMLEEVLIAHALKHRKTLKVERSHGQHAAITTHGREVVGWAAEVRRGRQRLLHAKSVIGVGKLSGEIGTHTFITPEEEKLALAKRGLEADEAPTQVISRDRYAEVLSMLAINGGTLERIATDIRLSAIPEVGELREPFSGTGSSSMPHKENPELSERLCGMARVLRGDDQIEKECMALWWGRDISHSSAERFTLPDAYGVMCYMTKTMIRIMNGLRVYERKMEANIGVTYGAIYTARLLNTLIEERSMPRKEAYRLVQGLAKTAMDTETHLSVIAAGDPTITSIIPPEQLAEQFDPSYYLRYTDEAFRRMNITLPS